MNSGLIGLIKELKNNNGSNPKPVEEIRFEELPIRSINEMEQFEESLQFNKEKYNQYVSVVFV